MSDPQTGVVAQRRRDSLTLIGASVVNGLTAYAIAALGAWSYGAATFAPFANLWTTLVLAMAAVTFPLQHWIIRTLTIGGSERAVRESFGRIARSVLLLALLVSSLSWLLADRVFAGDAIFAVFAGVLIVESGVIGLSRGLLVGRGRVRAAAVVMGGENLVRIAAAGAVVMLGWNIAAYGAAMLTGVVIVGLFPSSVGIGSTGGGGTSGVMALLGGVAAGTLFSQIVLVSAPLVVAMRTDQLDQITAMFATTALARAPFLVALGLGLQGTALLAVRHRRDPASTVRSSIRIAALGAVVALVGGAAYGVIAPVAVPIMFGPGTGLSQLDSFLIGTGALLAVASLFLSLVLVVLERGGSIAVSWLFALLGGGAVLGLSDAPPTEVTAVAFMVAETVALALLTIFAVYPADGWMRRRRLGAS